VWLSYDNRLLYLSLQSDVRPSQIIAARHPTTWNRAFDR